MSTMLTRRGHLTGFVNRHGRAWEVVMTLLALGYLALAIKDDQDASSVPEWLVLTFSAIFLAEFVMRFLDAPDRLEYLRGHWLDLVSAIPLVGGLRALRVLRLLRLGAAVRLLVVVEQLGGKRGDRNSFWFVMPSLILLWAGAAYSIWFLEHGKNQSITDFGDALYWAFITVTTVGYGEVAPVTAEGRILAGVLIFTGLGLLGFASSRLTAMWLHQESDIDRLSRQIDLLHEDVRQLRQMIAHQHAQLEDRETQLISP